MPAPTLHTKRLTLRQWRDDDLTPFAALNADTRVMEHFPAPLTTQESNTLAEKIQKELAEKPYGLWAVEVKEGAPFIGFIGLHYQDFPAPFTPCIEIGWRLAHSHWGHGYAYEGASRVLDYALTELHLPKIVSFTATVNKRSIRLMEKLYLHKEPPFEHPKLPKNHPLRPHVLYSLKSRH